MTDPAEVRQNAWRAILGTQEGQIVLAEILGRCAHFRIAKTEDDKVRQQLAIEILQSAGVYGQTGDFPLVFVANLIGKSRREEPQRGKTLLSRMLSPKENK